MASNNHTIEDVSHDIGFLKSNVTNRGRLLKYDRELLKQDVKRLPLKERCNYKVLSQALGVPKTTLIWMVAKEGVLKRHSSTVKPTLDETKKVSRLLYCLDEVYPVADHQGKSEGVLPLLPLRVLLQQQKRNIVHLVVAGVSRSSRSSFSLLGCSLVVGSK